MNKRVSTNTVQILKKQKICYIANMAYIHCPDCNAIRETDSAACLECGRCAYCGQRLTDGAQLCECGFPENEKLLKRIVNRYGIPEESLDKERAKYQRKKKLEPIKRIVKIIFLGISFFGGAATACFLLADSNPIMQVMLGMFLVSMFTFFYWAIFLSAGKVLGFLLKKFNSIRRR
jgi:hypothetical protein